MDPEAKKTVLVVEDDIPTALAMGSALEQEGYAVLRAADGEEGLRIALEKHPDVILVDLMLPKVLGMKLISELRHDEWGKNARVVILTNASDMGNMQAALMNQAFYYLVKGDSSVADVLRAVRAQVAKRPDEQ